MPERRRPLTRMAHEALAEVIRPGDTAVDATAGNGHDTLFLARRVGPAGRVHAFDIQPEALEATRERLAAEHLSERVVLHLSGHERMRERLPAGLEARIAAVTFNLGYLPGGDHALVTRPDTTLAALEQAARLLRAGGLLSVLVYRGHAGGAEEAEAVARWFAQAPGLSIRRLDSPGPVAWLARKHAI